MKAKLALFIILTFITPAFAAECMDTAVTQTDMNQCSLLKAKQADAKLNQIYKQVLMLAKNDPIATKKIRAAEQAWMKYRDAQIAMYYPPRPAGWYGSAQPLCNNAIYEKLTQARISELEEWLEPHKEEDVCAWHYVK